ncbi:nitrilase/cyanide hydratase and apolipoprotein N-acyltransferase family protein [Desulforapulum autotrophicum HRM2]|uniref:Nitrilase/cyanide hydratase and apolipoprotein N-acyltransferase family protein n=1 Tax=Desulforapulum autotrophicum (strain ATCC 43914 / DSM 3382 / VKM B-1955 / HRM2) TaxID=177437 RepID=C0QDN7_DESAH|nr:nitrilase-related carbon-nitrogen hydrolase [Desulforapulum autotrophicum]ACN15301.1 nitrilase/cyanide hydratase and apolipoprotein N-acyltransferase family protein [Desulforapulum autotrophicum HRM2]
MKPVRVALVIQKSVPGNSRVNLETCLELAGMAARRGAEIVLFPELNLTGYSLGKQLISTATTIPGALTKALIDASIENKITLLAGMAEKDNAGHLFSTHVAAMADGTLGVYRKLHIPPPEKKVFTPGTTITTFQTDTVNFGIQVCYDAHFPELSTRMALKGAEVLFFPHASPRGTPQGKLDSWLRHLTARAFDNSVFVLACNQVGNHGNHRSFPGVAVAIGPDGNIISHLLADRDELLIVDLDSALLEQIKGHRMRYFLPNRREDL